MSLLTPAVKLQENFKAFVPISWRFQFSPFVNLAFLTFNKVETCMLQITPWKTRSQSGINDYRPFSLFAKHAIGKFFLHDQGAIFSYQNGFLRNICRNLYPRNLFIQNCPSIFQHLNQLLLIAVQNFIVFEMVISFECSILPVLSSGLDLSKSETRKLLIAE